VGAADAIFYQTLAFQNRVVNTQIDSVAKAGNTVVTPTQTKIVAPSVISTNPVTAAIQSSGLSSSALTGLYIALGVIAVIAIIGIVYLMRKK
jgi:siroheme synthase (precorrin-2 oxidase/ferrochelatase)